MQGICDLVERMIPLQIYSAKSRILINSLAQQQHAKGGDEGRHGLLVSKLGQASQYDSAEWEPPNGNHLEIFLSSSQINRN